MSYITDILVKAKATIEANSAFAASLADVYMREPTKQDHDFTGKRQIFLYPDNPRPGNPELVSTLKIFRINVLARFTIEGRTQDVDIADDVITEKGTISDALLVALALCNPWEAYAITNIYHVEWINTDLNHGERGVGDVGLKEFEILQQWDFHAF
jgi:hypothetical protein